MNSKVLREIISAAPKITSTELLSGNTHRASIVETDIRFKNTDYLTHAKHKMN